jgi:predicted alpha/beta-hydrolase family hydrolase
MKRGKRGQAKKSPPKRSLNLPDLDQAKSAVLNSLPSKEVPARHRRVRHLVLLRTQTVVQQGRCDALSNPIGIASTCAGHD